MSNRAQVIIRGRKYRQIGTICMDQLMVNLEKDSAFNGDEVILWEKAASKNYCRGFGGMGGHNPLRNSYEY